MDFVTFEIAKKLKEKGFKELCIAYYWEKINEHTPSFVVEDKIPEDGLDLLELLSNHNRAEWSPFIDAPTIAQVLKWLREEKEIHICVSYSDNIGAMWEYEAILLEGALYQNAGSAYVSYEQAVIAGIEYVLDNLI